MGELHRAVQPVGGEAPDLGFRWRTRTTHPAIADGIDMTAIGAEAGLTAAAKLMPARGAGSSSGAKPPTVYFEVNPAPYAAGESSFMGETLTRLGAKNIIPAALGPFPKINPEFVVRANPDVIMVGLRGSAGFEQRPGWAAMRALREKRLCVFSNDDADVLVRPGPRMAEAAMLMAQCLKDKTL